MDDVKRTDGPASRPPKCSCARNETLEAKMTRWPRYRHTPSRNTSCKRDGFSSEHECGRGGGARRSMDERVRMGRTRNPATMPPTMNPTRCCSERRRKQVRERPCRVEAERRQGCTPALETGLGWVRRAPENPFRCTSCTSSGRSSSDTQSRTRKRQHDNVSGMDGRVSGRAWNSPRAQVAQPALPLLLNCTHHRRAESATTEDSETDGTVPAGQTCAATNNTLLENVNEANPSASRAANRQRTRHCGRLALGA